MKKLLCILISLLSITCFSQKTYTVKSGGRVFENSQRITSTVFREKLENNPEILKLFNQGRTKKTVGNLLLWSGLISIIGNHYYNSTIKINSSIDNSNPYNTKYNINSSSEYSNTMYFVGAGLVLTSIPIKIGFSKKIKKAVEMLNEENSKPKTTSIESTSIIANENGVGVSIKF